MAPLIARSLNTLSDGIKVDPGWFCEPAVSWRLRVQL